MQLLNALSQGNDLTQLRKEPLPLRNEPCLTIGNRRINAMVGVVAADFVPTAGAGAWRSPQGWVLDTDSGYQFNAGRMSEWEGQPEDELEQGDVLIYDNVLAGHGRMGSKPGSSRRVLVALAEPLPPES